MQVSVDALRPVFYDNQITNKPEIGLIAHEVQEYFPVAVNGDKDGAEYQSINYVELISIMIHEIQGLKSTTNNLKTLAQTIREKRNSLVNLQEQINTFRDRGIA